MPERNAIMKSHASETAYMNWTTALQKYFTRALIFLFLAGCVTAVQAELPEDRDWTAFINEGQNNYQMKMKGDDAVSILENRVNDLIKQHSKTYDEQARVLLLVNQELWEVTAESKAHLLADDYRGGTHAGLAYRYALIDEYLKRIRELKEIYRYRTEP